MFSSCSTMAYLSLSFQWPKVNLERSIFHSNPLGDKRKPQQILPALPKDATGDSGPVRTSAPQRHRFPPFTQKNLSGRLVGIQSEEESPEREKSLANECAATCARLRCAAVAVCSRAGRRTQSREPLSRGGEEFGEKCRVQSCSFASRPLDCGKASASLQC